MGQCGVCVHVYVSVTAENYFVMDVRACPFWNCTCMHVLLFVCVCVCFRDTEPLSLTGETFPRSSLGRRGWEWWGDGQMRRKRRKVRCEEWTLAKSMHTFFNRHTQTHTCYISCFCAWNMCHRSDSGLIESRSCTWASVVLETGGRWAVGVDDKSVCSCVFT